MAYDHLDIEQKWQKYWIANKTYKTENWGTRPKKYILDMFPYPSGAGLHVGHPKWYTATDIVSRYYHATGHNVLHTMGFDAFGLPAENYAIKTWTHPAVTTAENIAVFMQQLQSLGFSYDWDRMVDTTDPEYYQWTQWIFLELFKRGLAYEQDLPINYCPHDKTGLANEEVVNGCCERCGTRVERRAIRQWVLRITEYADRLLTDLDWLDWPEGIKEMQRNWIGRSEGCEFRMMKEDGFRYFPASGEDFQQILKIREKTAPHPVNFSNEGFFVVKQWEIVVWFIRVNNFNGFTELGPLYIEEDYRGKKLGHKLISYAIEKSNASEFYLDCKKELAAYYEQFGFTYLNKPQDFQIEKLKKVWGFYRENFTENDIREATAFMSIRKKDFISQTPYISVYTTRIDTVYGMTYAVLAPDHPQVQDFIAPEQRTLCEAYIETAKWESDQDRTNEWKEKTGVFTGSYVINPYNGESVPLWIADYVLGSYGTGAVMAVPAHDERDFEFAKKYDLPIRQSVDIWISFDDNCWKSEYSNDGNVLNNNAIWYDTPWKVFLFSSKETRKDFIHRAESEWFGKKKVNYKLRDWLFSRQRYWGEPIPLIHITNENYASLPREKGDGAYIETHWDSEFLMIDGTEFSQIYTGITGKIIIDASLPLTLPAVDKYEPAGDGQSPLATVPEWVNVRLADNLVWKRETNTMPQWWGSCWYYLRYMDPQNPDALASKEALNYWGMVDEYVGGAEHAVLHLLYARFWHKVLYDIGVVPTIEPFHKLTNVGLILGPDGNKMSKSKGNVINPNDIVREYGADTLRLYEMSISAFTDAAPWNPDAIIGVRRFLDKAYMTIIEGKNQTKDDMKSMKLLHKTIKKVGEDIVGYKFNTAISALQILLNEGIPTDPDFALEWREKFSIILHPFAPHMAEELFRWIMNDESWTIYEAKWPEYDEWMLIDDEVTIAIQINGKLRGTYTGLNGVMQDEVSVYAYGTPEIAKWLENKILVKEIFIPNKMLSIVVKDL